MASSALPGSLAGKWSLVEVELDRYKGTVAVCSVGKIDLADWLVRGGLAIEWPRYSEGRPAEAKARW